MFEDVFGLATQSTENFRDGVRDSFGAALIADVLDPILKEIDSLRIFNEDFKQQSINVVRVLEEARTIQFEGRGGSQ